MGVICRSLEYFHHSSLSGMVYCFSCSWSTNSLTWGRWLGLSILNLDQAVKFHFMLLVPSEKTAARCESIVANPTEFSYLSLSAVPITDSLPPRTFLLQV